MPASAENNPFLQLVETNKAIIYKVCHSYCRNQADREDLAQEIVYQLWRSAQRYDESLRFTTWMYRVALNTAISFYRKQKNDAVTVLSGEEENIADAGTEEDENLKRLQTCINGLKDLEKALMLLYLEGHSHKEIAGILGITVTNVATSIGRVKEKIKQKLNVIKS